VNEKIATAATVLNIIFLPKNINPSISNGTLIAAEVIPILNPHNLLAITQMPVTPPGAIPAGAQKQWTATANTDDAKAIIKMSTINSRTFASFPVFFLRDFTDYFNQAANIIGVNLADVSDSERVGVGNFPGIENKALFLDFFVEIIEDKSHIGV